MTPTIAGGEKTWQPQQLFLSHPAEAFYGLGQMQDGIVNWHGIPALLQQFDSQIAVPMLLSSRGYGLLWNNPALTVFNPTDEKVDIDPVTKEGKFTSEESGVYGFMTSRELPRGDPGKWKESSLKVNGVTVVQTGWSPPRAAANSG